ncbi:hypothetical protein [Thalassobellus sediminis]|uniref:hypothetical protein n=1 Tax=Thalassobellus sediminis TaxID=3367753 RepID=UPI0037A22A7A
MKIILRTILNASFIFLTFLSCNKEELFIEQIIVNEEVNFPKDEDEFVNNIDTTKNCDFNLDVLEANETIIINCILDLNGETINLPNNVTIIYQGGDIINGTLNFSENTIISGELLNSSLNISGSSPQMKDTVFNFNPKRWGIIEGVVSDSVALKNKLIIQDVIDELYQFGIDTFKIGKMDAYFAIGDPKLSLDSEYINNGIHLPSNFNFEMTDETFLRVQPNKWFRSVLLGAYIESNITITGGNLIGDRFTHDYSPITDVFGINRNSHEGHALLLIGGCKNVVVDGVNISNSTGDGFIYGSGTNRQYTPAVFCENILVKNCKIEGSRRNNVTFGDGEYLTLENCIVNNAGGGEFRYDSNGTRIHDSSGVAPQFGIDLEAHRELDANGKYIDYQKIEHVVIRGNKFTGNYAGDIVIFTANDVLIENNTLDNTIGGILCYNTTIRNNTIIQNPKGVKTSIGIGLATIFKENEFKSHTNKIIGNTIIGFNTGMAPGGRYITVKDNIVKDFKEGIYLKTLVDSEISNNTYESLRPISYGYLTNNGKSKNLVIKNDKIKVNHRPISLSGFNSNLGTSITSSDLVIENCEFISPKEIYFENSRDILFRNNKSTNKTITQINCTNLVLENNN